MMDRLSSFLTANEGFLFGRERKFFYYLTSSPERIDRTSIPYSKTHPQTKEAAVAEYFSNYVIKQSPLTIQASKGWLDFFNNSTLTMVKCEYTPDKSGGVPRYSHDGKPTHSFEESYKGLPELARVYNIRIMTTKPDASRKPAYETARKLAAKIFTTRICNEYGFGVYTSDDDLEEFIEMDCDNVAIIHIDTFEGSCAPDRGLKRSDPVCIKYTSEAQKVFDKYFAELKAAFAKTQYGKQYQISDDWGNPVEGYVFVQVAGDPAAATEASSSGSMEHVHLIDSVIDARFPRFNTVKEMLAAKELHANIASRCYVTMAYNEGKFDPDKMLTQSVLDKFGAQAIDYLIAGKQLKGMTAPTSMEDAARLLTLNEVRFNTHCKRMEVVYTVNLNSTTYPDQVMYLIGYNSYDKCMRRDFNHIEWDIEPD